MLFRSNLHPAQHVLQKYTNGFSFLQQQEGGRRKIYVQNPNYTPADTLSLQSWIMMPYQYAKFARIDLPSLSIAHRTAYSHYYWMKHTSLHQQGR
mgnify:FL=1